MSSLNNFVSRHDSEYPNMTVIIIHALIIFDVGHLFLKEIVDDNSPCFTTYASDIVVLGLINLTCMCEPFEM